MKCITRGDGEVAKWTEEQKLKALAIADATSAGEASKQTGIPRGTVLRWMSAMKSDSSDSNQNESNRLPKKVKRISEEAIEEAKAEVKGYMVDRVRQVSDGLLELVELAKAEAATLIRSGQDPTDSKAQWLRSVVGAIAQGVEKHQLLEGKPTSRQAVDAEVKTIHEQHYHITQEIIAQHPELADELIRRRMVDRRSESEPSRI
jgi:transposase